MTKTLVKGAWYTVTTASTCSVTDANGTPLGTAEAGKQFTFQATTEQISFSDDSATVLVNPNHAPVAASSSHGTGGEEQLAVMGLQLNSLQQLVGTKNVHELPAAGVEKGAFSGQFCKFERGGKLKRIEIPGTLQGQTYARVVIAENSANWGETNFTSVLLTEIDGIVYAEFPELLDVPDGYAVSMLFLSDAEEEESIRLVNAYKSSVPASANGESYSFIMPWYVDGGCLYAARYVFFDSGIVKNAEAITANAEAIAANAEAIAANAEAITALDNRILGKAVEDALSFGDPTVESITHSDYRQSMALCPGFEEPVSMNGTVTALRVPRAVQRPGDFDGFEEIVNYCIFSSYDAAGSLIGTTRGDFTVTLQDIYVEFEEPLDVITGGKIKFEFGFRDSMSDYGVGYGAPCFDCYYVTNGKIAKKEGARLLKSAGLNPAFPVSVLPEIVGYTLFRTIYYKPHGAVDEKIAVHADDTTAHLTATERTGLTELLANKDALLALLQS